jgi:hypothetical protein
MKISKSTLDLLKNFSSINTGIIIREGNEIGTMNNGKSVVAFATVPEKFPVQFGIYDLNNFISTVNLFEDPDIEFGTNLMTITGGASRCSYGYAEESVIISPKNKVNFPGGEVNFTLTKDVFDRIMKASQTLQLPMLCVTTDDDSNIVLKALDPKNPNGNAFSVVVGRDLSGNKYNLFIQSDLMKMVRGDYDVSLSSKFVSHFKSADSEYFVALEKTSEFIKASSNSSVPWDEDGCEGPEEDNE